LKALDAETQVKAEAEDGIDSGISKFKVPRKHGSKIVDFNKGGGKIHEINDENV
jgi:hypothetical protein